MKAEMLFYKIEKFFTSLTLVFYPLFVFENPAQIVFRSYKEASRRLCLLWEELVGRGTGSEVRKHLAVCFINDEKLLTAASFPLAPTNASGTT